MPRQNGPRVDELLRRFERRLEDGEIFNVGRLVPDLPEDLRERRAAAPRLPSAQVNVQQSGPRRTLEVRRDRLGDVRTRDVVGDGELAGRLHHLLPAPRCHAQRVLAAVDATPQRQERVTQRRACAVHARALSRQFGGVHPVSGGLDVGEGRHFGPHEVGDGLGHRHACHGGGVDEPLDGLLPTRHGGPRVGEVRVGGDGHVGQRDLQGSHALLLGHQAADGAVHLVHKESFGSHRDETEDTVEDLSDGDVRWEFQRFEVVFTGGVREGFLGHLSEDKFQRQVHWRGSVGGVLEDHLSVSCDISEDAYGAVLSGGNFSKKVLVGGTDEEGVVLLVLRPPYFEDRERVVADVDLAHVVLRPRRLHDLLENVPVPPCPLVVHTHDRIVGPEVAARPHETDHPVLHLRVAALDRVEIQRGVLRALHPGTGRPPADADAVAGSAHLDHEHALLRVSLGRVARVHQADSRAEHDGLHPLDAFSVRQPLSERPREAVHHRLAEFISVIARPVARSHENVQGRGQVRRVREVFRLPGLDVTWNVQVSHAVAADARDRHGAASRGAHVPQTSTGARLGTGDRGDPAGKIVRLRRKYGVERGGGDRHGAGSGGISGTHDLSLVAANGGRIVVESNNGVIWDTLRQRGLDHAEQSFFFFIAVDDHLPAEEPVPRVFRVALPHVEALYVRRIAPQLLPKEFRVVIQVEVVETEAHFGVGLLQRGPAAAHNIDRAHGHGLHSGVERS
mmetsp:Transcript_20214/g.40282  ORF Transcript_20214/g.40282 Transcript_20214/m.40282 type:complete len:735 (+) Transcript_20214:1538-3742(+)